MSNVCTFIKEKLFVSCESSFLVWYTDASVNYLVALIYCSVV